MNFVGGSVCCLYLYSKVQVWTKHCDKFCKNPSVIIFRKHKLLMQWTEYLTITVDVYWTSSDLAV